MECELVDNSYSKERVGEGFEQHRSTLSYTEILWQALPQYMAMGMSNEEFWKCDPQLYKAYREKYKIVKEQENERLWLQGLYVYDALCRVAPRFNSLKPKKGEDYVKEPYKLKAEEKPQSEQDIKKSKVMAWAKKVNKNYGR